jgi:two-component system cell cycle sensor histidine kinase/response regulator CckA
MPWRHQGQIRGLIYKVSDNAAFASVQNQLYQAQKMETLGTLTAGVAHDFNNLLLAIRGNAGLALLEETLEDTIRNRLQQLDQAATRAGELAHQLLAFGRVSEEKIDVLDFNQVIREAADLAKCALRGRISLRLNPTDQPLKVRMDAIRAQQLLLNLCINAADAMPERGEVTITNERVTLTTAQFTKARRPGHEFMCCRVADTGSGIPPEVLPRIFSPFFTTKPKGKGTGLGLAVGHEVIAAAGGFIEVESAVGKGTTFRVYLPLDNGPLSAANTPTQTDLRKGCGRLLVVDDLDLVLEFASSFLEQAGYEVLTAVSADAALATLEKETTPVDLVLTDYAMPGRDGLQLIREIAARWPKTKRVIASGYLDDDERARIRQMEGVRILGKPYSITEATKAIAELLGRPDSGPI